MKRVGAFQKRLQKLARHPFQKASTIQKCRNAPTNREVEKEKNGIQTPKVFHKLEPIL
jgi:hypothetical protein